MGWADIQQRALATANSLAGVSITYRRGETETTFDATPIKKLFHVAGRDGASRRVERRGYQFALTELAEFTPAEPRERDQIVETDSQENESTRQVTASPNGPPFDYVDHGRLWVQVWTSEVGRT